MLANGSNAMESQLPDASGQVKQTPVVEKLHKFCEDMETLKAERQAIEAEIKETIDWAKNQDDPDPKNEESDMFADRTTPLIENSENNKETMNFSLIK